MKPSSAFLFLFLVLSLSQCQNKNNPEASADPVIQEERVLFPETKDSIRQFLRAAPQLFAVSTAKDTLITTASGLAVTIPAQLFVDENNQPVTNVTVEIVEAFSVTDFIKNGLSTTSGDEVLESGGMFYINAQANGKPVKMKEDRSLTVQVPAQHLIGNMQVFYGNYNAEGALDWSPAGKSTGQLDNSMIALPRKMINLSELGGNAFFGKKPFIKKELEALDKPEYEDTYIMTNEFKQRLTLYLFGAVYDDRDSTALHQLLQIYTSNTDKNLSEADKMAIDFLKPRSKLLFAALKDSVQKDSVAALKDTSNFGTSMKFVMSEMVYIFGKYIWDIAQKFPDAKCTKPINFKALNIDSTSTRESLIAGGQSPEEADKLLFWYQQRNNKINGLQSQKNQKDAFQYTMSVKKFGWVNIDRFLNDENCQESNFTVRLKTKDSLDTQQLSLIFPVRKICISNTFGENGVYSFTKKGTIYRKLPIGEDAYVLAMGTKGTKHYFGLKKIKIPATGTIDLSLNVSSLEEIKTAVEKNIK